MALIYTSYAMFSDAPPPVQTPSRVDTTPAEARADAEGDGDAPPRIPGAVRGLWGAAAEGCSFLRAAGNGQDAHGKVRESARAFFF